MYSKFFKSTNNLIIVLAFLLINSCARIKSAPEIDPAFGTYISAYTSGLISIEKLTEHWKDIIDEMKPFNHSIAGVMRSTRPKTVKDDIVTIEAFYPFHQEKLSETKTRDAIALVLKKLFGEKVKVEVVLGKK